MTVIATIRERLAPLAPMKLEIDDESALHAGHEGAKGGGGHYRMHIVAAAFQGKGTLERHRLVYQALGELMRERIHALSIRAQAPEEL
jgi:BolA protein